MVKPKTIDTAPETDLVVAKTIGTGKFTFTVTKGLSMPVPPPRAPSPLELPFKDWFAVAEHNESIFVPNSFWFASKEEGGRGRDPAKTPPAWIKTKLRDSFKAWQAKDAEARAGSDIVCFARKAGDEMAEGLKADEDGVSVFFLKPETAPA